MSNPQSFASDNNAGVHPKIMQAIQEANHGHVPAYGDDHYTQQALDGLKKHFGDHIDAYFVFNGTGANVVGLSALTKSYNAVICAQTAHINEAECGAPEKFTGCKLFLIPTTDGKITVESIKQHMGMIGFQHQAQPKVVSITQATEYGTVYTPQEIKVIADFAHEHGMFVHMDGARLANAAAYLNVPLRALTTDVGVDVLSFGGTKNGLMFGEAVIFFNRDLSVDVKYVRKQAMQLASKMRFLSAQFSALLADDLWLKNAKHANAMAQTLAQELAAIPHIKITQQVQTNGIFACIPAKYIKPLQEHTDFYVWNEAISEVRLMMSWDTTEADVKQFCDFMKIMVSE